MNDPDILYHYCSVDSFYKIVQSNEIWLSDSYVLNDYKENTWITPIIKEIFATKRNLKYGELFDKILQTYDLNNYIPFVCYFSTDGDVLSQWRAYADDGAGVANSILISYFKLDFSKYIKGPPFSEIVLSQSVKY